MDESEKAIFENSEALVNWTYPGATLYINLLKVKLRKERHSLIVCEPPLQVLF